MNETTLASKTELVQGLSTKQDTITDLSDIRTGATAGATAVQPETLVEALNAADIFAGEIDVTDNQRNQALANVSNQTANSTTGKLGYKVLDPTKAFAEQVTAENTIYEIRDVFDLGGTQETPVSVILPAGSTLKFNGGLIKNCTIVGSNTSIDAGDEQVFENIKFNGSFYGALNALWIGAKQKDSTFDNSTVLQKYFDSYAAYFNTIKFPEGSYYFKTPVEVTTRYIKIDGDNSIFYTLIDDLNDEGQVFLTISQESFILDNVRIYNARKTGIYDISKTIAVKCSSNSHLFSIKDTTIMYFDIAIYLGNVWYGGFSGRVALMNNRIGVFGNTTGGIIEINTIDFKNLRLTPCSKDAAKVLYPKQDGESDADWNLRWARCGVDFHCCTNGCKFNGMVIEGFDYGIRFNYKAWSSSAGGEGVLNIYNCYFEGSEKYDIYVGRGYIIGSTGYYYNFHYKISISQCLFHTIKKVYLSDCIGTILSNSGPIQLELYQNYYRAYIIYDDSVGTSTKVSSSNVRALSLKSDLNIPSNTGNVYQSTVSQLIKSLEQGVTSALPSLKDATINEDIDYRNGISRRIPFVSSLTRMPRLIDNHLIKANEILYDGTYFSVSTKSGNSIINVSASNGNGNMYNQVSLFEDAIEIEEFIRRWNAGTTYTGYVKQIFNVKVITDPSTGLVYNENNTVIGFGKKAIDDNFTFPNAQYFINVDTLCSVFYGYGVVKFECDLVQNCRTYGEVIRGIASSSAGYSKARFICTTTQRDSATLIKHVNKIIYNTTDKEYQIWDGVKWNTLSNPWTRYSYKEIGKSISERAIIADLSGQTFFNYATGIRYTFYVDLIANTHHWITSIGSVASIEHPNGYDATNNPIEYATEIAVNEMVMYNGSIVKWDGTQFVNLDGTPLS